MKTTALPTTFPASTAAPTYLQYADQLLGTYDGQPKHGYHVRPTPAQIDLDEPVAVTHRKVDLPAPFSRFVPAGSRLAFGRQLAVYTDEYELRLVTRAPLFEAADRTTDRDHVVTRSELATFLELHDGRRPDGVFDAADAAQLDRLFPERTLAHGSWTSLKVGW